MNNPQKSSTMVIKGPHEKQLIDSLRVIRERCTVSPKIGIILGSGLGNFTSSIKHATSIKYGDIPHFPKLSAAGHAGEWITGYLGAMPIVAMRGRAHLYEGHSTEVATYGVRVMAAMGIDTLIVSNAAGGMNSRFQVGDLVMIDGHIDLMNRCGLSQSERNASTLESGVLQRGKNPYDPVLRKECKQTAEKLGITLHDGTYLATLGPTYETRAEYRAFRMVGADMVGMSTVPEVLLASKLGIRVGAFSVITNIASPDSAVATSHDEVLDEALLAQVKLTNLLTNLLENWSGPPD